MEKCDAELRAMGLTIFRLGYCYGLQTQENSQDRKGTGSGTGVFAVIHLAVTTGPQEELLIQARKHPVSITSGLNQPPQLQTLCSAGSSMRHCLRRGSHLQDILVR